MAVSCAEACFVTVATGRMVSTDRQIWGATTAHNSIHWQCRLALHKLCQRGRMRLFGTVRLACGAYFTSGCICCRCCIARMQLLCCTLRICWDRRCNRFPSCRQPVALRVNKDKQFACCLQFHSGVFPCLAAANMHGVVGGCRHSSPPSAWPASTISVPTLTCCAPAR